MSSRNHQGRPAIVIPVQTGYQNLQDGPLTPSSFSSHASSPLRHQQQQPGYYDNYAKSKGSSRDRTGPPSSESMAGSGSGSGSSLDHRGAAGVATGAVGGGYGPYSYDPTGSRASSSQHLSRPAREASLPGNRYSKRNSSLPSPFIHPNPPTSSNDHSSVNGRATGPAVTVSITPSSNGKKGGGVRGPVWTARDAELDDKLHNPSPHDSLRDRAACTPWSLRGWLNMAALVIMVGGLVSLFAGYPILQFYTRTTQSTYGAFGPGGINASGQVPAIPGLPDLIDKETPASALTRTGFDGKSYVLAFSDEFNTDGRTFWPGDDPYWEAVDLHYWQTGDFEWYDPDAITTKDGSLVITLDEEPLHNLNFRSGMLQSWNKFCFTGGYIEVSLSLPGSSEVSGFWPGAWTMGNLGRAGYGATTDGTWPYSYNTCDLGTLPNQTNLAGTGPAATLTTGTKEFDGLLSYQPGQRVSACTCEGGDHPGPNVGTGRGAPEIDIIEAQISWKDGAFTGGASQTCQLAPYDAGYTTRNTTPYTVIFDADKTILNTYTGGPYQQAVSAVTFTNPKAYALGGAQFESYGFEAWPDPTDGYITWSVGGEAAWTMTAAAVGPNAKTQIGQRLVSTEPMYIILNLGLSSSFQNINWQALTFPGKMLVDYVRVYQLEDEPNLGCSPSTMPTTDYINNHMNAYTNPNYTTWAEAGYKYPKNSMQGC